MVLTTYLVVAALVFAVGIFWIGLERAKPKYKDRYDGPEEGIPGLLALAFFWPLAVVISPFVGLYFLGRYLGSLNAKSK